jgi:predicted phage tail protein
MNVDRVQLNVSTGQVRTIRLYGALGREFGRVHHMAVNSAGEAIRALMSQYKGFQKHLIDSKDKGIGYAIFYGKQNLDKDQLFAPCGDDDIRIAPAIIGGKSPWIRIIIGVILIVVVSFWDYTGTTQTMIANAMFATGVSLVLGGVTQLLTPAPKGMSAKDNPMNQPSYNFNGPVNTQAQGHPVAVLYGELIVGSAVLSAGISAVDQAYIPAAGGGSYGGGTPGWVNETQAL